MTIKPDLTFTSHSYNDGCTRCWVISDGKAGTEAQALGLAESLGIIPEIKRIRLRLWWCVLSPVFWRWGLRHAVKNGDTILSSPWPDLVISCGRHGAVASMAIGKKAGDTVKRVHIQNPRINPKHFDVVIAPFHDDIHGDNVVVTLGSLHRVTPGKCAAAADIYQQNHPVPAKGRKILVVIGGKSKDFEFTPKDATRLAESLLPRLQENDVLYVTTSRRTGAESEDRLRGILNLPDGQFYGRREREAGIDNPYFAWLGMAEYIMVTEDSTTMIAEALAIKPPVIIIPMRGGSRKFRKFRDNLLAKGYARMLDTVSVFPSGSSDAVSVPDDMQQAVDAVKLRCKS